MIPVSQKPRTLPLCTGFILIFWLSRLIAIDVFPPFLDEIQHVHQAELSLQSSPLAYAVEGRLFTLWWYMLFQPQLGATVWLMRAAALLLILPGFAAMISLGRLMAGRWGLIFAALVYFFSTFHFFFERMALGDPISGSAVSVALYCAYRLRRRVNLWDALFTAIALFIAVGAKATTLPYLGIPIAAALKLRPTGRTWRENGRWFMVALGGALTLVGLFYITLRLLHHNPFDFIGLYNGAATAPIFTRTLTNIGSTLSLGAAYVGPLVLGLLLLSLLFLALRGKFYLLLCLFGPALVLWVNERYYSRYYTSTILILLLCGAVALADVLRYQSRNLRALALILILGWGLVNWLPFAMTADTAPTTLKLWSQDALEYIDSDASGSGLAAVHNLLASQSPVKVIGELSNCQALRYLSLHQFPVDCPPVNPDGEEVAPLAALMSNSRIAGVYAVLEDIPFVPKTAPGRLIGTIQRPQHGPMLSVYDLSP